MPQPSPRLTVGKYKVSQIEVKFTDGHVDVVRVYTKIRVQTVPGLFQSFPISRLQWNRLEQNDHDQI